MITKRAIRLGTLRLARRRSIQVGVFIEAPLLFLGGLIIWAIRGGDRMQDFAWLREGVLRVVHGQSPYTAPDPTLLIQNNRFIYPPLDAYILAPIGVMPRAAADVVFLLVSVVAIALALRLFGVRDWRCYGLALLSPCTYFALSEGTLEPLLLLGLAAAWRSRNQSWWLGLVVGLTSVAKLFLWPLVVWLIVTRRFKAAAGAVIVGTCSVLVGWAAISFAGLRQYPTLLRVLDEVQIAKSYSLGGFAWDVGAPAAAGTAVLIACAIAGCAAIAYVARHKPHGDEMAFALAVLTSLATTPLLWIHYLVLLLAPIALVTCRLSWLWAAPLVLWMHPFMQATPGQAWEPLYLLAWILGAGIVILGHLGNEREGLRRKKLVEPVLRRQRAPLACRHDAIQGLSNRKHGHADTRDFT